MKCTIQTDILGNVTKVTDSKGKVSQLFTTAAQQPIYEGRQDALEVITLGEMWQDKLSVKSKDRYSNGEPKVYYQTPQGFTESYKEALTQSAGSSVEFGFKDTRGALLPIRTVSTSLNNDSIQGVLNNAIVGGQLEATKFWNGSEYTYRGTGDTHVQSRTSANKLMAELMAFPESNYTTNYKGEIFQNAPKVELPATTEINTNLKDQLTGTGQSTQGFFGDVVNGADIRFKPSKSYEYEQDFNESQEEFREMYDSMKGNFDEHIATSIPTFRELQVKKGTALVGLAQTLSSPLVYDLGGSEGSFIKTITNLSGGAVSTINLDPSPEMQKAFEKNKPANSTMAVEAFMQGWDGIPTHVPTQKAGVVHESMMFQFIENQGARVEYLDEVKDKYMSSDGIFLTEEKFKMNSDEEFKENERLKESHKDKYYTKEQQSLKSDEVLIGMKENQANYDQYLAELNERFAYVVPYWTSGNFRGIIASDNKVAVDKFLEDLGQVSNPAYTVEQNQNLDNIIDSVVEKLNQTGLSSNTQILNSEEIEGELSNDPQYQVGIGEWVKGYATAEGGVVLNRDTMTLDTPIHEFGHLWNSVTKENNPKLYRQGLKLIEKEGQQYIQIVNESQPWLVGEALYEEALAQAIGDSGAKIIDNNKKSKFSEWLTDLWNFIAEATGISQYSNEELQRLSLEQFSEAIAVEILKGQTVQGALESNPGEGTTLTANKETKVNKKIKLDIGKYPAGEVVELPVMTLKEVIAKYKGKIYLTTSDATTVSVLNGELIQGGPGYISLKKNVEEGVGFAALDAVGAKTAGSKIYSIGKGDPVAVLVMVQSISATLGNAYGGDFLYSTIKKAHVELSPEDFNKFKSAFKTTFTKYYDKNVKDIVRDGFIKEEHKAIVLTALDNIENISLEEFHDVFIKDTNFNFRRNLMEDLVAKLGVNSKGELGEVKNVFRQLGANYQLFKDQYVDPNLIDMSLEEEGAVVAGFEVRTDFETSAEMSDYIMAAQTRGVQHKMFNGKMPSEGSFLLDGAYGVNDNFNDYSKGETIINPEFTDKVNKLIGKWNSKYKGFKYEDLKTGPSIAFKKYLGEKYPQYLLDRVGNAARDVARGMGLRQIDGAAEKIYTDYVGNRFSMQPDKYGRIEINGIKIEKSPYTVEEFKEKVINGKWGMLTGQNPQVTDKYGDAENYRANQRAKKWIEAKGYKYSEIYGKYGDSEQSFFVEDLSREDAIAFAKEFNQDSVATNEALVYRDGTYQNKIEGTERFGGVYEDFFSTINIDGTPLSYQVDYSEDKFMEPKKDAPITNEVPAPGLNKTEIDFKVGEYEGDTLLNEPMNYMNSRLYPYMTEDGEGNFVFYHYSKEKRDSLKPGSKESGATPSGEGGSWSFVGGTVFYYTRPSDRESIVQGEYGHEVKIDKRRVYDFNADRQNFYPKAKELFEKERGNQAFNPNNEIAYITKIATQQGYQMVVASWEGKARANSIMELTPTDFERQVPLAASTLAKNFENKYISNQEKYKADPSILAKEFRDAVIKRLIDNGDIEQSCDM